MPEMTLSEALATPGPFRAWLEDRDPNCPIGLARRCRTCPVAVFLVSRGFESVSVWFDQVAADEELIPTPKWLTAFLLLVDYEKHGDGDPITVGDCFGALPLPEETGELVRTGAAR